MKKFRMVLLSFILLLGFANRAFAELSPNRIALGVQLGAKFEDVNHDFGVPDRITME